MKKLVIMFICWLAFLTGVCFACSSCQTQKEVSEKPLYFQYKDSLLTKSEYEFLCAQRDEVHYMEWLASHSK